MKKYLLALGLVTTVLVVGLAVVPAGATAEANNWFVCKYVGPPASPNETLKAGQNPIFVDENSVGGSPVAIGAEFADGQDQSVVIAGPYAPNDRPEVDPVCPTTPATSTTPPPPPPTTTTPPPPPPTTTTTPPPPPPTTTTVPPVTTTVTLPPPHVVPCKGSVALGPWYGDPRINITLRGAGTFVVSGGVQRFTGLTTITKTLACNETLRIGRYKVERGHYLTITQDSVLITHIKPPMFHTRRIPVGVPASLLRGRGPFHQGGQMIPCTFCQEPCDPRAIGTFIEQTGWSENRMQGGSNQLTLRRPSGRVAHKTCIHLVKRGINVNGQGVLG